MKRVTLPSTASQRCAFDLSTTTRLADSVKPAQKCVDWALMIHPIPFYLDYTTDAVSITIDYYVNICTGEHRLSVTLDPFLMGNSGAFQA